MRQRLKYESDRREARPTTLLKSSSATVDTAMDEEEKQRIKTIKAEPSSCVDRTMREPSSLPSFKRWYEMLCSM